MITVFGIGSDKGSYLQDISDCPRNEDGLRDEESKPPVRLRLVEAQSTKAPRAA